MSPEVKKLIALAHEQRSQGVWPAAAQTLQKVLALSPEYYLAWNLLGKTLLQLDRREHATKAFLKAVKLKPEVAEFHHNLGQVLAQQGQLTEATTRLKQAVALDPKYASAYQGLGEVFFQQGFYEKAAPVLLEAVRLQENNSESQGLLGITLNRLGRTKHALKHLQKALQLNDKNSRAVSEYAQILEKAGEREKALRTYRQALTLNPVDSHTMLRLCGMLMDDRRYNNVITLCDQSLERIPGHAASVSYKIMAHLGNGGNQIPVAELMDFDRFLVVTDLPSHGGFPSLKALNNALAEKILDHPSLQQYGADGLTRFGRNTTDILSGRDGPFASLAAGLRKAVETYVSQLDRDEHTFARGTPKDWRLTGFGVVIEEQGLEPPKIRPESWLSGIYFVRLPTLIESSQKNPGWVEFGKPDREDLQNTPYLHRQLRPEEGQLFLFPSYFFHNNVPFESELERITVRFDVRPY